MSHDNPAHKARIKCTDHSGSVQFLYYADGGWKCSLSAEKLFAGISENQAKAGIFALDQCQNEAEVLEVVRRYASPNWTFEPADPDAYDTPRPGCYRAVDPTGTKLIWVPLPEADLKFRLHVLAAEAQAAGWALAWWNPDELEGVNVKDLLDAVIIRGNDFIDFSHRDDPEDEDDEG